MTRWRSQARGFALSIGLLLGEAMDAGHGIGQQLVEPAASNTPLPDIPSLMHAVERNQHAAETLARHYLYHSIASVSETDKHGVAGRTAKRDTTGGEGDCQSARAQATGFG